MASRSRASARMPSLPATRCTWARWHPQPEHCRLGLAGRFALWRSGSRSRASWSWRTGRATLSPASRSEPSLSGFFAFGPAIRSELHRRTIMPILEDLKEYAERATGLRRPEKGNAPDFARPRKPHAVRFKDDGLVPNHPRWSLIIYRGAVELDDRHDPAAVIEDLFEA